MSSNMLSDTLSFAGATDTPSLSSFSSSTLSLPSNFYTVMRQEYLDTNRLLPSGRKRRSKDAVSYVCNLCKWRNGYRQQAVNHVNTYYASESSSTPLVQRQINIIFTPTASIESLRDTFNLQRYRETLVGLLTRRKIPLSAVK